MILHTKIDGTFRLRLIQYHSQIHDSYSLRLVEKGIEVEPVPYRAGAPESPYCEPMVMEVEDEGLLRTTRTEKINSNQSCYNQEGGCSLGIIMVLH